MALKHSAKVYPDSPSIKAGSLGGFDIRQSILTFWYLGTGKPYPFHTLVPVYEAHCCLLSAIAVPFYYVSMISSIPPIPVIGIFVNSLILALTSTVIFYFSLELYKSKRVAFILGLIFGVCSFAWPYNTTLHPQPLVALLFIASAYFTFISPRHDSIGYGKVRRILFAGLGGLFLGLSIFALPTSILVVPGFVLYAVYIMKNDKQSIGIFLIIFIIIALLAGLTNYWRFGSFTNFGYGQSEPLSINHGWEGLVGLLVSPGYGLIFFFPIVILLPIALKYSYKQNKLFFFLTLYILIINLLYFGTLSLPNFGSDQNTSIWDGLGWGPRYLICALPFITIVLGTLLQQAKTRLLLSTSLVILCVAGFSVNLLGKLVASQFTHRYGWNVEGLNKYELASLRSSDQQLPTKISSDTFFAWLPSHSLIILSMKALMSNYITNNALNPNDGYWRTDTLVNCPYDLYIYCKIGIGPTMLFCAIIAVLATVIIMDRPRLLFHSFKRVSVARR